MALTTVKIANPYNPVQFVNMECSLLTALIVRGCLDPFAPVVSGAPPNLLAQALEEISTWLRTKEHPLAQIPHVSICECACV